ncbi:large subunit of alpha-aminoadipate reductase, partial [Ascosphaera atra]
HFSETEQALAQIWAKLIPNITVQMIGPDDSFFDLGGHSILAQQMIFELRRKWMNISISMSVIFQSPTLKAFAAEIDRLQDAESLTMDKSSATPQPEKKADDGYAQDAKKLVETLPETFPAPASTVLHEGATVFLTGATGFLGAYVLKGLLSRKNPSVKVVALVRAKSQEQANERVRATCQAYGSWSDEWASRIECVQGNLGDERLGLTQEKWDDLVNRVDVVIHNGALVHWVYPYSNLRAVNVLGTIDTLKLCASGKPKQYAFVSSTSVLDTDHYVSESESIVDAGGAGLSEADDLQGSAVGLGTGYGQSKWAAEYIVKEAGRRGLEGTIVRPGYVTGDSTAGVTNTDDFLVRFMKGCVQLSARPNINNSVNMVPVDHVASVVIASAFNPPVKPLGVAHVTGHPRLKFNQFLGALETYGYQVPQIDYVPWAKMLEKYVHDNLSHSESQNALMPLYHFVTADLPSQTKAPELDDTNAAAALSADAKWSGVDVSAGAGVTESVVGIYLSYLISTGFLPAPTEKGVKELPTPQISEEQKRALANVGGRGGGN